MDLNLWKDKAELKKYLDNLGTEYRYGCYEENNPDTCHLLGDFLLSIDKAHVKAAQVYKKNCDDNGHGLSCDAYARMAYRGQSLDAPNYKLALDYFIKGCDLNEPRACYHGGQMLGVVDNTVNKIIPPDPERSLKMLKKACFSSRSPDSCTRIHSFYLRGCHGMPPDLKLAADFAQIACHQNQLMGCYNLSRMYHLGEGVEQDMRKSNYYKERVKEIKDGQKVSVKGESNVEPDV